jgi:hypothetical protein
MVILTTAFIMSEPPVLAATIPKVIKNAMVKPYNQYSIPNIGASNTVAKGINPPTKKEAPEAIAA